MFLIPLHGVAVSRAFVVLESVGEGSGVASEREVVAGVRSQNHRARHIEAVQITLKRCRCH